MDQSFIPRVQVMLDWIDDGVLQKGIDDSYIFKEDVCGDTQTSLAPELAFNPKLAFVNDISDGEPLDQSIDILSLRGRPVIGQYYNFQPELRSPMDLRNFPFDQQRLKVEFCSTYFDITNIKFVFEKDVNLAECVSKEVQDNSEWTFVSASLSSEDHEYPYLARYDDADAKYQHIIVRLTFQRNPWYYLLRVVLVSGMLNLMETCSFMVEPVSRRVDVVPFIYRT